MEHMKHWFGDLLEEIDNNKNKECCVDLLKKCGANCAKRNALPHMTSMKTEISRLSDMDEIVETISRYTGAECIPAINGFIITYNRGNECDCPLVRAGYVTAPVFCNCTKGFHEAVWGMIFERPITVELLETFLGGGNCCSYRITFK